MLRHKLYCGSVESPHLNSSMESLADQSNDSPVIPRVKKKLLNDQDQGDCYEICSSQNSIKSENYFTDEKSFFADFLERKPYSYDEDVEILNFVLKDQNIYKVSSILLWKYLEAKKKCPKRTYQSLKNRFLRNIKPKIFTTYRHLIKNQDQVKKIVDKFPELKKDSMKKDPLPVDFNSKKLNDKVTDHKVQNINLQETSGNIRTLTQVQTITSTPIEQVENNTAVEEESGTRKVIFSANSISVTVHRNLMTIATSSNGHTGIYEKYLNCKAKNKLKPCPTCGQYGGPELEQKEVQDSDNENDIIISNSIGNKNSEHSLNSKNSKSKISSTNSVANKIRNVNGSKSRRAKSSSESSHTSSNSPSLLDSVKSLGRAGTKAQKNGLATRTEKSTKTKSTNSNASKRRYVAHSEGPPGDLTDEELESLYNESVQKCEKLMDSEEEEALVKKCFKKNRRSIGFDSYVLLNKCDLDSFFAKSQSPPVDSLITDPGTSKETTKGSLMDNMKRMLRSRNCNKS